MARQALMRAVMRHISGCVLGQAAGSALLVDAFAVAPITGLDFSVTTSQDIASRKLAVEQLKAVSHSCSIK
jgi:hypothetical protein